MSEQTQVTGTETTETRSFQAETAKILDLMIHSVYSNREVFLRELISNASDAIDKVRFLSLTDEALRGDGDHNYAIVLRPDSDAHTLVIEDNGVGMSYDEVVSNIGTIARSGTSEFVARLEEAKKAGDMALIGRFGVGFYSSFIVAERVVLETWKFGEEHGVRWESRGDGNYSITRTAPRSRGTSITLYLKAVDEADETVTDFSQPWSLRETVRRHSDFVSFPIVLETPAGGADDEDGEQAADASADGEPKRETINRQKPLWTRDPKEITDDEHAEFYRHLTHDWGEPADRLHVRAEGMHEFVALLYVPKRPPVDLYAREGKRGLSLYVRNIFVMDQCRELLPEYMRFVRGLVDSPDLPLNMSREVVQQDRLIAQFRKVLVKRLFDRFAAWLADKREDYETFWAQFGPVIKEAMHYDPTQQAKLEACMLVRTTRGEGWSTLAEVKSRFVEGQESFYYLVGDEMSVLSRAPHLEVFAERGIEVVLFSDPIDQVAISQLGTFGETKLTDAADPHLELGAVGKSDTSSEEETEAHAASLAALVASLGESLKETVQSVRASRRLRDSAAVLVSADDAPHASLERMMRAMGEKVPERKRVLELNPTHPLVTRLVELNNADAADDRVRLVGELLVDQALIASGDKPRDPALFVSRLNDVMSGALKA